MYTLYSMAYTVRYLALLARTLDENSLKFGDTFTTLYSTGNITAREINVVQEQRAAYRSEP